MNPRCYVKTIAIAVVAAIIAYSCATPVSNVAETNSAPEKSNESAAAEINRAIATLALSTAAGSGDYQIGPEDRLQITLHNIPESEARNLPLTPRDTIVRVSQEGIISLPLLGDIKVVGLTPTGLARQLQQHYGKYLHDPQVGVSVTEYRQRISVIGAVQKAGVYELSGPKTLIDILATAGGVNDRAGSQVHIYRQGPNGRESHVIDLLFLANNVSFINAGNAGLITMPVQAGDVINVPPAGTFFVDGAVRRPGPYLLGRRYSLTQALATAGGVDRELYASAVTIFRRKGNSSTESIAFDIDDILAGSIADPQIQTDDVIVVPMSSSKYFFKRFVGTLVSGGISIGSFIPAIGGS